MKNIKSWGRSSHSNEWYMWNLIPDCCSSEIKVKCEGEISGQLLGSTYKKLAQARFSHSSKKGVRVVFQIAIWDMWVVCH